nr:VOC family protein [Glaciihabitans sp. dw_435]
MSGNTSDHPSFRAPRGNQAFELNFECANRSDVELAFRRVVDHGGAPIASPAETGWGHFTVFFADPEGNIHSLFAVLPR